MSAVPAKGGDKVAIRLFGVTVPEAELTELRRDVSATRWPERQTSLDTADGQFAIEFLDHAAEVFGFTLGWP